MESPAIPAPSANSQAITLAPRRTPAFGFALLVGIVAMVAVGKVILYDTMDPDAFWHLRVADELVLHGPRPLVDHLSFMSSKEPWIPYSWLAELGMKWLWDRGGYRAAIAAQAIMEGAFVLLISMSALELSRRKTGEPRYLNSALASVAAAILSLGYLSFRPNTLAIDLLALIGWLILRDRRLDQRSKLVWLVPPVTAILTNIHFFAILSPVWLAMLLTGDAIEKWRDSASPRIWRGAILLIATLLGSLMTPLLAGTIGTVINYSFHDAMVRSPIIAELQPFYRGTMGHVAAVVVGLTALCLVYRLFRRDDSPRLGEIFWFIAGLVLMLKMGRMAPMFAVIGAPVLAATMPKLSDLVLTRIPVIGLCALLLLFGLWRIGGAFTAAPSSLSTWLTRLGPDIPTYPCAAADYVERSVRPKTGRLINEFTWGGYLEWRLGPQFQTLMDGRIQIFPPSFWQSTVLGTLDDRKRFLAATNADVAILPKKKSIFQDALIDLGWTEIYSDDQAVVIIPPDLRVTRAN